MRFRPSSCLTILFIFLISGCAGQKKPNIEGHRQIPLPPFVVEPRDKLRLVTGLNARIQVSNLPDQITVTTSVFGKDKKKLKVPLTIISSGFLTNVTQKEDEIAAIIAHHWAHIQLGHIRETTPAEHMFSGLTMTVGVALTAVLPGSYTLAHTAADMLTLSGDRAKEEEADRLGFSYLTQAGYNGEAMLSMWTKVQNAERSIVGATFVEHPWPPNRFEYLNDLALGTGDRIQE
jgi:Zn-dependent protease with chaperone function